MGQPQVTHVKVSDEATRGPVAWQSTRLLLGDLGGWRVEGRRREGLWRTPLAAVLTREQRAIARSAGEGWAARPTTRHWSAGDQDYGGGWNTGHGQEKSGGFWPLDGTATHGEAQGGEAEDMETPCLGIIYTVIKTINYPKLIHQEPIPVCCLVSLGLYVYCNGTRLPTILTGRRQGNSETEERWESNLTDIELCHKGEHIKATAHTTEMSVFQMLSGQHASPL